MNIRRLFQAIRGQYRFSAGGLTFKEKLALALPGPASTIGSVIIHNALMKFYIDIIGIDPVYTGWIYFIYNIWNAINDPLLGVFVDRFKFRPKRGKYVYLMRVTAPIMIISTFAMLFSSPSWDDWVIFLVLLLELFIFDTAYTIYSVSYQSYFLVAAPTKEERIDVEVIRSYIGNALGFLGTIVPTLLLVGNGNRALVIPVMSAVIGVNAIMYFIALRGLKEKLSMYSELPVAQPTKGQILQVWKDSFIILKSKEFLTYLLYNVTARGAMGYYFTPFLFFMDHVIRSSGVQATLADVIPGIFVLIILPVIGSYIKKFGSKAIVITSYIPAFIGFSSLLFITTPLQAIFSYLFIYLSLYMSGTAAVSINGALIDDNEQKTGVRKTGLYNGLFALFATTITSVQSIIFTNIISYYGYDGAAAIQSESAVLGIRIGAGVVPLLLGIIGFIPLLLFPINKKREQQLSEFNAALRRNDEDKHIK
ncbi:MFS transporter [Paenibacillus yanchengensis]|uniref:MFS transporter n=1 Tax=Paenibacillus yanchengensis TaxID=2035833 RepID=A0ABW4YMM5_9BACL